VSEMSGRSALCRAHEYTICSVAGWMSAGADTWTSTRGKRCHKLVERLEDGCGIGSKVDEGAKAL
jgi:hypothetical protein